VSLSPQIEFYGDPCTSCCYSWAQPIGDLIDEALALEPTYRAILGGLPGTARHPDLDWCASAYVLHVADNLRQMGERMANGARGGPPGYFAPDQDELAALRRYELIGIEGALWSLASVTGPYVEAFREAAASGVVLPHPARGDQSADEVLRGNLHDAHHHAWDLRRIAEANGL
jgi:hypothetical protein